MESPWFAVFVSFLVDATNIVRNRRAHVLIYRRLSLNSPEFLLKLCRQGWHIKYRLSFMAERAGNKIPLLQFLDRCLAKTALQ
jgi:hypothetical protein